MEMRKAEEGTPSMTVGGYKKDSQMRKITLGTVDQVYGYPGALETTGQARLID